SGSRRIRDVMSSTYSPAPTVVPLRPAPAMKRNVSIVLAMSSSATSAGLPQLRASSVRRFCASASSASASWSMSAERSAGVRFPPRGSGLTGGGDRGIDLLLSAQRNGGEHGAAGGVADLGGAAGARLDVLTRDEVRQHGRLE